jgi:hypothetical protein
MCVENYYIFGLHHFLFDFNSFLSALSESVLGEKITMAIIRRTFFKHFCAGIDGQDIQLPISRLRENGVGSILDYAAEADISASSSTSVAEAEEATCDANLKLMMESIAASSQSPDAFTAIKLTALGRTVVLERCSQLLTSMVSLFHKCHNSSSVRYYILLLFIYFIFVPLIEILLNFFFFSLFHSVFERQGIC